MAIKDTRVLICKAWSAMIVVMSMGHATKVVMTTAALSLEMVAAGETVLACILAT